MFNRIAGFVAVLTLATATLFAQPLPAFAATQIDNRYNSDQELRQLCGSSISNESSVLNGKVKHYQSCTLYWSPTTGVHEAHGVIRDRFRDAGGVQVLGFPTSDEYSVWVRYDFNEIGRAGDFENATIGWSEDWGTKIMTPTIADDWKGDWHNLLMPKADTENIPGGKRVKFVGASIYQSPQGSFTMFDDWHGYQMKTTKKWGQKGGAWSFLGLPSSELLTIDNGYVQLFQNGRIYWQGDFEMETSAPEAFEVHGAILNRYLTEGGPEELGYPVSDQQPFEDGYRSRFQHADILLHPSGSTIVVPQA